MKHKILIWFLTLITLFTLLTSCIIAPFGGGGYNHGGGYHGGYGGHGRR